MIRQFLAGCSIFALCACSGSEQEAEEKIDYAAFDDAAVEKLVEEGKTDQVLEILKGQEELGIADLRDFLTMSNIYEDRLDGVAAEVAIEKARDEGADAQSTALSLAKALLVQGKFANATAALDEIEESRAQEHDVLVLRADIAKAIEDFDGARGYLRQAIEAKPEDVSGYLGLSILELEQGNFELAEKVALDAANYAPDDPLINYVRGTVARHEQRLPEAITLLSRAVSENAGHVPALMELTGAYIENNDFENARKQLKAAYKVEERNPMIAYYDGLIYAIEGDQAKAEEMLLLSGDMIKKYPPATRTYAHVTYRLGKCETAQPYFERFLNHLPTDTETILALADCYTRMSKPQRALAALKPILEADPDNVGANLQAAGAAGLLRNLNKAVPIVARAFTVVGQDEGTDLETKKILGRRLAFLQFTTGDHQAAVDTLTTLLDVYDADIHTLNLLTNIRMEDGDMIAAEETASLMLEKFPEAAEPLNLMGAIRYRQRKLEEAVQFYDQAIAVSPQYQSALKNRSLALVGLGNFEAAEADLLLMLEKIPDDGSLLGLLGRVYLEQGKPEEALIKLKQAHQQSPKSVMIAADYALALAQTGYVASAIAQAEKAKSLITDGGENVIAYIDGLIEGWEQQDLERRDQVDAEKARVQKEINDKLDAKELAKKEAAAKEKAEKTEAPDDDTGT